MSFRERLRAWFARILAAIGIGSARLQIESASGTHPRGSVVEGIVHLEGGYVTQHVEWVKLSLFEFWGEGKHSKNQVRSTLIPVENLTLAPGQRIEYPFQFQIPDDM